MTSCVRFQCTSLCFRCLCRHFLSADVTFHCMHDISPQVVKRFESLKALYIFSIIIIVICL